jgi:ABC-type sugar transport system permease subunit
MMLIHLWTAGVNMIVFLAAIRAVPADLTEAALIDGADGWQRFRHITWPLISPATFYLLLINLIGTFQVFTPMYLLTGGGPNNATLTLPLYIYQTAFAWGSLGYASALSAVLFALVLGLTALLVRSLEPRVYYLGHWA